MSNLFIELGIAEEHTESKFENEFIFISRIYSRFISKIKVENLNKITILIESKGYPTRIIPPNKLIKVCVLYRNFNLKILENESIELKRYQIILALIKDSILELARKFNWPEEEFINAYQEVCHTNFIDEFEIIAAKSSKNKRFKASVNVTRNKNYCSIFVKLKDNNTNEIREIEILKTRFYEDNFSRITKTLKWINNDEFQVSNKEGELNFIYSILDQKFEVIISPKIHQEEYLQDELKLLDPFTPIEEFNKIINKRIGKV